MIAVAANFNFAMEELVSTFEAQSGHTVNVSYGSSGRLYAQIINGAPFQLFFSADQEKPEALVKQGYAEAASRFTYATGSLVLWSANPELAVIDADVLNQQQVEKLAIANPRLAPYGAGAMQVLGTLGLEDEYRDRLVMGENVNQAFQFVTTGNAQAGLISLSQVIEEGVISHGAGWIIPADLYAPIHQDAVLLKQGADSQSAREFLDFIKGKEAGAIITKYGYSTD